MGLPFQEKFMNPNDILRRIRFVFDINDSTMMDIFGLAGSEVTRAEVSDWLKQDESPEFKKLTDSQLASFLNGFIIKNRGKKEGPIPVPEAELNNNIVFRKLKIALNFQEHDVLEVMNLAGFPIGKHELSALFRKADHKNFRPCQDQMLRNFLNGLQLKFRSEPNSPLSDTVLPS
jgi:uncharacterized protein YehS (DUF1456 family)